MQMPQSSQLSLPTAEPGEAGFGNTKGLKMSNMLLAFKIKTATSFKSVHVHRDLFPTPSWRSAASVAVVVAGQLRKARPKLRSAASKPPRVCCAQPKLNQTCADNVVIAWNQPWKKGQAKTLGRKPAKPSSASSQKKIPAEIYCREKQSLLFTEAVLGFNWNHASKGRNQRSTKLTK